jgi:hypothetical protein
MAGKIFKSVSASTRKTPSGELFYDSIWRAVEYFTNASLALGFHAHSPTDNDNGQSCHRRASENKNFSRIEDDFLVTQTGILFSAVWKVNFACNRATEGEHTINFPSPVTARRQKSAQIELITSFSVTIPAFSHRPPAQSENSLASSRAGSICHRNNSQSCTNCYQTPTRTGSGGRR